MKALFIQVTLLSIVVATIAQVGHQAYGYRRLSPIGQGYGVVRPTVGQGYGNGYRVASPAIQQGYVAAAPAGYARLNPESYADRLLYKRIPDDGTAYDPSARRGGVGYSYQG